MTLRVVMVGPSPQSRGGMATVIGLLLAHGLGAGQGVVFLPTQCDGSRAAKLWTMLSSMARFAWALLWARVDVLHVHVASGVSFWRKWVFMRLAQWRRVPVVFHLHGGQFAQFVAGLTGWRARLARRAIAQCAEGLALTRASEQWLAGLMSASRVRWMPNPVVMPVEPATQPRRLNQLLFVGRLESAKGIYDLLEALVMLRREQPGIRLVACGDGDLPAVQRRLDELGLGDIVTLAGWVDASTRQQLLDESAVFVLASHVEQLPMSLLEAMASATPVVATAVGAVPDMIEHGVTGWLVPAGAPAALSGAIAAALRDPSAARVVGAAAREMVAQRCAVTQVVAELRAVYSRLATSHGGAAHR